MEVSSSATLSSIGSQNITICTTGITKIELGLYSLPPNIILSNSLTPSTKYLISYKCLFTEKYIQALKWNIPILSIGFLSDLSNPKNYQMRKFEGAVFTTSSISNGSYSNYMILHGATYKPNCSINIDFLICDNPGTEKYQFCEKYNIPIIPTREVFTHNYHLFKKQSKYDANKIGLKGMFFDSVFFIDKKLPVGIFNKLRRLIVENEGSRFPAINDSVNYILTINFSQFEEFSDRLIYYQYVFDCIESDALLYAESYRYHRVPHFKILHESLIVIDERYMSSISHKIEKAHAMDVKNCCSEDAKLKNENFINNIPYNSTLEYTNKLLSMGANIQTKIDMRTTHFITDKAISATSYFCVTYDWIDQCLISLKKIKETKYSTKNEHSLSLRKKVDNCGIREMKFQFTGLDNEKKIEIIKKLDKFNIKYADSEKYEACTHLIMGRLNSSEKFFSSLVNGNWILRPEFIDEFENQPYFDLESFEWNGSNSSDKTEKKILNSIRKWRVKIQRGGRRPFHKWNIKLYCDEKRYENYHSLIVNGGGCITDKDDYTHVFVDKHYTGQVKEQKKYSADYLFSHLFK